VQTAQRGKPGRGFPLRTRRGFVFWRGKVHIKPGGCDLFSVSFGEAMIKYYYALVLFCYLSVSSLALAATSGLRHSASASRYK